ncbi:unnamed protein product [Linum tenue]|uniref:Uncharacterized protein n=1 Tax=Linum tenue TaxID=586396 RepID=A0AAV0NJ01_9ROSI|nr:unnamed protein product [Linum tenue]
MVPVHVYIISSPVLPPTRSIDGDGRGEGYFCVVVAGLGIGL